MRRTDNSTRTLRSRFGGTPFVRLSRVRKPLASFQLESLESRRLLSGVNFAVGYGSSNSVVSAEAVTVDAQGNSYVTGNFGGTVSFGGVSLSSLGARNIFVEKIDSLGNVAWAKQMGSSDPNDGSFGRGIALDPSGNVVVSGIFVGSNSDGTGTANFGGITLTSAGTRNAFVEKLDGSGNVLWARGFGSTGATLGQAVAVDASGNIYQTGSFENTVAFGGTNLSTAANTDAIFVQKLNSSGATVLWAKQMAGSAPIGGVADSGFGIALDSSGNVYTTGIFAGTGSFGTISLTSRGDTDAFVQKQDTNGNVQWVDQFGGTGHDDGDAITVDRFGNIYATGDFIGQGTFGSKTLTSAGNDDAYNVRIDGSAGAVVWATNFGGPGYEAGFGIATDSSGNVYSTGYFGSGATTPASPPQSANFGGTTMTSNGGFDLYLVKQDPNGNVTALGHYGGAGDDFSYQVAIGGPKGNLISLVGTYSTSFAIGNNTLPTGGTSFVTQLDPGSTPGSNFNKAGYTQIAVYRPSQGLWIIQQPSGGVTLTSFGDSTQKDLAAPADFAGVGSTQLAVYRPGNGYWIIQQPTGGVTLTQFGDPAHQDIPAPADYDGTGKADLAVYRASAGLWIIRHGDGTTSLVPFGDPSQGDIPVPGDYDGTGKADLALYRPSQALWIIRHADGTTSLIRFGDPTQGDQAVPGDYDGIGKTQLAVWRPGLGLWIVNHAGANPIASFGEKNYVDIPTQASAVGLYYRGLINYSFGHAIKASIAVSSPGVQSASLTTTTAGPAATIKTASIGTRSSVVTNQGTATKSAWESALEDLYN